MLGKKSPIIFGMFVLALVGCSSAETNGPEGLEGNDGGNGGTVSDGGLVAFPGAEGFGGGASGGRGGQVIYVTNLNPNGPGSLNEALRAPGPRYILFKVSGVIDAAAEIIHGDVTLAGQTSPGGIIVRGLICDEVFEAEGDCDNIIVRHIRSRPATAGLRPSPNFILDDALRLDGVSNAIFDHVSLAHAIDEAVQVSQSQNITLQNSILAETLGDHFVFGGMLINYSTTGLPLQNLSFHHNMWHRIGGRMPEISCEENDGFAGSNCTGLRLNLELSNNLLWDPGFPIYYTGDTAAGGGGGRFFLNLNWVNNFAFAREGFPYAMMAEGITLEAGNNLFFSGNRMNHYPGMTDNQLVYCCNDFPSQAPNTQAPFAQMMEEPHAFPSLNYTATEGLMDYMVENVGAFPRDPMDRRFLQSVAIRAIDPTPLDRAGAADAFSQDFDPGAPPSPPVDSDGDGMPDNWELAHGLNPSSPDHNGIGLSLSLTGVEGYTNLECYLNQLAEGLLP